MKLHAAVLPFIRSQHGTMPTPRGLLRILLATLCLNLAQPFAAVAQTSNTPLPPAAQEALDKGIIAAKVPDYLLAIRYFEEARKLAPQSPVVFLNMGLAESRIPGRELRAMAWFGAYLAAYPDAPNAAAVKEQISVLEVRNQSNVSRLIKSVQDGASAIYDKNLIGGDQMYYFSNVALLWVKAGDVSTALRAADLYSAVNISNKIDALHQIARAQAKAGDGAGALKTADLIQDVFQKQWAQRAVAEAQIEAGDSAGAKTTLASALKTVDLFTYHDKSRELITIAFRQIEAGDIAGATTTFASALKTVDSIQGANDRRDAQSRIAEAQIRIGDITGAKITLASALKTADFIQEASNKSIAQSAIAEAQIQVGDITGARTTLSSAQKSSDLIQEVQYKSIPQFWIAKVQAKLGDIAAAQKTADLIQFAAYKKYALTAIASAQKEAGNTNTPSSTRPPTSATKSPIEPAITVSDWLKKLDDANNINDCPLNTEPFLDLASYLKSLPPSDNPKAVLTSLYKTAKSVVEAQKVITAMLKQQANK